MVLRIYCSLFSDAYVQVPPTTHYNVLRNLIKMDHVLFPKKVKLSGNYGEVIMNWKRGLKSRRTMQEVLEDRALLYRASGEL